jgi:hypothetical protein
MRGEAGVSQISKNVAATLQVQHKNEPSDIRTGVSMPPDESRRTVRLNLCYFAIEINVFIL